MPTLVLPTLVLLTAGLGGCDRKEDPSAAPAPHPSSPEVIAAPVPFEVRDDTPGMLLTWVGENGDFEVADQVNEVPEAARELVRVVVRGQPAGTPDSVFVANLKAKNSSGTYPVRQMSRAAWDELGASKRKQRLEALAPLEPDPNAPLGDVSAVRATVYGADWCKPCHLAEDYLRKKGLQVEKKDIEESDAARSEMNKKLQAANMGGASIPVLDVGGILLVGFSPRAVDAAIRRAAQKLKPAEP